MFWHVQSRRFVWWTFNSVQIENSWITMPQCQWSIWFLLSLRSCIVFKLCNPFLSVSANEAIWLFPVQTKLNVEYNLKNSTLCNQSCVNFIMRLSCKNKGLPVLAKERIKWEVAVQMVICDSLMGPHTNYCAVHSASFSTCHCHL